MLDAHTAAPASCEAVWTLYMDGVSEHLASTTRRAEQISADGLPGCLNSVNLAASLRPFVRVRRRFSVRLEASQT